MLPPISSAAVASSTVERREVPRTITRCKKFVMPASSGIVAWIAAAALGGVSALVVLGVLTVARYVNPQEIRVLLTYPRRRMAR